MISKNKHKSISLLKDGNLKTYRLHLMIKKMKLKLLNKGIEPLFQLINLQMVNIVITKLKEI